MMDELTKAIMENEEFMLKCDTIVINNANLYRYSLLNGKLDTFTDVKIVHRNFGKYDAYLAFVSGLTNGTHISSEEVTVSNRNGLYFYVWSEKPLSERRLNALFLKAIRKYIGEKVHALESKMDKYKMRLESAEENLKN